MHFSTTCSVLLAALTGIVAVEAAASTCAAKVSPSVVCSAGNAGEGDAEFEPSAISDAFRGSKVQPAPRDCPSLDALTHDAADKPGSPGVKYVGNEVAEKGAFGAGWRTAAVKGWYRAARDGKPAIFSVCEVASGVDMGLTNCHCT